MTETEYPEWVYDRALEEANRHLPEGARPYSKVELWSGLPIVKALCAHIFKHEEAPVDPLLQEARDLVASNPDAINYSPGIRDMIRKGDFAVSHVNFVLRVLQRGGEIERGRQP